jgi:hypothetical protein
MLLFTSCFVVGEGGEAKCINLTVLAIGATVGWLFGVVLSPYDPSEKQAFRDYAKAGSVFVSGFLVAKIDKLAEHILDPNFLLSDNVAAFRTLGFIGCVILSMIITFNFRKWQS